MPDPYLQAMAVRPIRPDERERFDEELDRHHWLGHNPVGETMRHVALAPDGTWVALVGFGAAALACAPRERLIGWPDELHFRRLRSIVYNQRYCVLPGARRLNLASAVLARSLARLSGDYVSRWGHPVLVVETFVDPARHLGTCYRCTGFDVLGETRGFARQGSRSGERYVHHGAKKLDLARALRKDAYRILRAGFDHPVLGRRRAMIDLEGLDVMKERSAAPA